ncbi:fatty-acid--CoA ligase [Rhodococcus sp. 1163]|uniref:class I adenylate-forming enzyme family protein n=1 Tax=Rhodococcus sp. 1163 TaxID=1905289 RepID=UPI0009FEC845|nr:class I adenylate-forming enzyme family protein [Rhodococcus sp. 1163]ORI19015.1 fatty-acid--CoA ligase [Rhodococcus sp. 1163]
MTAPVSSTRNLAEFTVSPMDYTDLSVSELVRHWATARADEPAYISPLGHTSWSEYDRLADTVGGALRSLGKIGAVAVYLPDSAEFHATLVGAYRAGVLAAAIGARSGIAEVAHIITSSGATVLITARDNRGLSAAELVEGLKERGVTLTQVILVDAGSVEVDGAAVEFAPSPGDTDGFTVDEISLLNSTSGTTGRPKLVAQTQRRWTTFAAVACRNAELMPDEIIAAFVPAPFGFGLWTSHFLPALLGRPALVMQRFDADQAIAIMASARATTLAGVSTQFRMMLHSRGSQLSDVTTLRVMFTGGEAVPATEAKRFEDVTGAKVLQFYGSNETGAASATTVRDDEETRLSTGGYLIDEMNVRIFNGRDEVTGPAPRRGQPAVCGPLVSPGYWGDEAANAELFTDDGWVLLGDIVEVDELGRLRVVGRLADLIIRGGKNISAVEVEDHVREHPSVAMVAAVGVPDPIFGERLCVVVTLEPEAAALTLEELTDWLRAQGTTREYLPERMVVVEEMPMAPGGKIAKAQVKALVEDESR